MKDESEKQSEVEETTTESERSPEAQNERRDFLRKAAAAAIGVGLAGSLAPGAAEAAAPAAAPARAARTNFTFTSNIVPAALTAENIKKITDRVAASLANEAKSGLEVPVAGFHIRVGGGHSRIFSKTADHKNVSHSEVIIEGSGP